MIALFMYSVFSCVYGILGFFGIQNIPKRYRETKLEKEYKRFHGIGFLLLGVPWFILWLKTHNTEIQNLKMFMLMMAVLALPALLHYFFGDRKYRKLLKKS